MSPPAPNRHTPNSRAAGETYHLQLFVAGDEANSRMAKENLAQLCETHLAGRCTVEIIDVLQDFQAALANNVLVTPTLVVSSSGRLATIVGSLSDTNRVLDALGIPRCCD